MTKGLFVGADAIAAVKVGSEDAKAVYVGSEQVWPTFSPADIDGLMIWFDAAQIDGLADGDSVGTWPDMSGNGRHMVQILAGAKPTYKTGIQNGRPVVRFDGSDVMSTTSQTTPTNSTSFVVAASRRVTLANNYVETLWAASPSNVQVQQMDTNAYSGTPRALHPDSGAWGATVVLRKNGATSPLTLSLGEFFVGTMTVSGGPVGGGQFAVGAYPNNIYYGQNDIAELIQYNDVLDTSDIEKIEAYLAAKWGI